MAADGQAKTTARKRRSAAERREGIQRAAMTLFARRGYERTTTKEIAKEAGIAEGTIYRYFTSKEEILLSFVERVVINPMTSFFADTRNLTDEEVIRGFILDRLTLWEGEGIGDLIRVVFGEALFNPELARNFYQLVASPALRIFEDYLRRRIQEGVFREMDTAVAARALIGYLMFHELLWKRVAPTSSVPPRDTLATEMTRLFLDGVRRKETLA